MRRRALLAAVPALTAAGCLGLTGHERRAEHAYVPDRRALDDARTDCDRSDDVEWTVRLDAPRVASVDEPFDAETVVHNRGEDVATWFGALSFGIGPSPDIIAGVCLDVPGGEAVRHAIPLESGRTGSGAISLESLDEPGPLFVYRMMTEGPGTLESDGDRVRLGEVVHTNLVPEPSGDGVERRRIEQAVIVGRVGSSDASIEPEEIEAIHPAGSLAVEEVRGDTVELAGDFRPAEDLWIAHGDLLWHFPPGAVPVRLVGQPELTAPDTLELGEEGTMGLHVEARVDEPTTLPYEVGGAAGTWTLEDGDNHLELSVEPDRIGEERVRVAGLLDHRIEVERPVLSEGEAFEHPDGLVLAVDEIHTTDTYEVREPSGRDWRRNGIFIGRYVFAHVEIAAGEPASLDVAPEPGTWSAEEVSGAVRFEGTDGERYRGPVLDPASGRSGWVGFSCRLDCASREELELVVGRPGWEVAWENTPRSS